MSRVLIRELDQNLTLNTFGAVGEGVGWPLELLLDVVWRVP